MRGGLVLGLLAVLGVCAAAQARAQSRPRARARVVVLTPTERAPDGVRAKVERGVMEAGAEVVALQQARADPVLSACSKRDCAASAAAAAGVELALLVEVTPGAVVVAGVDAAGEAWEARGVMAGGAVSAAVREALADVLTLRGLAGGALLRVRSAPQMALVSIDGTLVGQTPSEHPVAPGEHVLSLQLEGFAPWQRRLAVTPGLSRIDATLQPAASRTDGREQAGSPGWRVLGGALVVGAVPLLALGLDDVGGGASIGGAEVALAVTGGVVFAAGVLLLLTR